MNILIVTPWDQEYGGVASVVGNLALQMQKKGHNVLFFHPGASDSLERTITKWNFQGYKLRLRSPFLPNRPIKSVLAFCIYLFRTLRQLYGVLSKNRIHVVNIHYPGEGYVYFALLRKLCSLKLVISVHGADLFPDGKKREAYSRALQFLMNSADLLVTSSRNMLQDVLAIFPKLAPKSCFIHNAVNMDEFEPGGLFQPAAVKEYILCVATHKYKKGLDILIRAFKELSRIHSQAELWLVGNGPMKEELEALTRELGLSSRIMFLGPRNRDEVRKLMQGCALFVLPSRAEPFGVVITEALANHKPVVATAVGGIREIIQNGVTGILVEPDNPHAMSEAMQAVLENEELRDRLAINGYESVKRHFQWEIAGTRYESAFSGLISNGNLKPEMAGGLARDSLRPEE